MNRNTSNDSFDQYIFPESEGYESLLQTVESVLMSYEKSQENTERITVNHIIRVNNPSELNESGKKRKGFEDIEKGDLEVKYTTRNEIKYCFIRLDPNNTLTGKYLNPGKESVTDGEAEAENDPEA